MKIVYALSIISLLSLSYKKSHAQQMTRMAKIVVDSAQLESYKTLLKEEIEASLKLEPGVQMLYAMSEKENPTHITIEFMPVMTLIRSISRHRTF